MILSDISVPEVYKTSADFRFFLRWFELCLLKVQTDTENLIDLLDPLRCPSDLLWMLADTCGYKYDERVSISCNRLITLNFPRLIRNRGSEIGMIYAAELNLSQFDLNKYAKENPILADRLDNTTFPVNSANVLYHTKLGYIEVIYVSENIPTDVCTEYVRPLGMYCFSYAGVQVNAKSKISVDARLTNMNDDKIQLGQPGTSFVGHYSRADYASLQRKRGRLYRSDFNSPDKTEEEAQEQYEEAIAELEERRKVWYRNKKYEVEPNPDIDPGFHTLYSLQLSNNEHVVKALLPSLEEIEPIFTVGNGPQQVDVVYPDDYVKHRDEPAYNLRLNRQLEESLQPQVTTIDEAESILDPKPAVNPVMASVGDAISLNRWNNKYTKVDPETGEITVVDVNDNNT